MKEKPFDWVSLNNGSQTITIAARNDVDTSSTPGFFLEDQNGIMEPGESTSPSIGKSFSPGSALNPKAVIAGKNISLSIILRHDSRTERRNMFMNLLNFLEPMNYTLATDWTQLGSFPVQYVSFVCDESGKGTNAWISGTLTLVSSRGW